MESTDQVEEEDMNGKNTRVHGRSSIPLATSSLWVSLFFWDLFLGGYFYDLMLIHYTSSFFLLFTCCEKVFLFSRYFPCLLAITIFSLH